MNRLLSILCLLGIISCQHPFAGKDAQVHTAQAYMLLDSALQQAADYYHQGNPLQQKAILDSIQPTIIPYESGTKEERGLYARFLRNRLIYYAQYTNQYDSMLYYGHKAKQHALDYQDFPTAVISMANMGDIMRQRGDLLHAFNEYYEALRLNDSIVQSPEMYLAIYAGLACSHTVIRSLDHAEKWAKKMQDYGSSMTLVDSISYYQMLGNCYYYGQRYDDCLQQFILLDKLLQQHPDLVFDREVCNVNLADIYVQTKQDQLVDGLLDQAIQYFTDNGITAYLPYIHTLQIQQLLNQGKNADACQMALSYQNELATMNPDHLATRYLVMSNCSKMNGKYADALQYYQLHNQLTDSLRSSQVSIMTEELEQRYLRDKKMEDQQLELQEHQLWLARLWAVVLLLALLLVAGIAFARKRHFKNLHDKELAFNKIIQLKHEVVHNRITPHFISNALVLGSKLSETEITDIISLIRSNLSYEHELMVSFDKEYDMVCNYVRVATRVQSNRIQFESHISPEIDTTQVIIPTMSLLIIVENAIKHGQVAADGMLHIDLTLTKTDKGVLLTIENSGSLDAYRQRANNTAMHGLHMLNQTIEMTNAVVKNQTIRYELYDTHQNKVIAKFTIYGNKRANH